MSGRLNKADILYPASPIFRMGPKMENTSSELKSWPKPSFGLFHSQICNNNVALTVFASCPSPSAELCHYLRPPQRHLDTSKPLIHHSHVTLCPPHCPIFIIPNTASISLHCYREGSPYHPSPLRPRTPQTAFHVPSTNPKTHRNAASNKQ